MIAPGFKGDERHSHGMLFVHKGELWTICARWGVGATGRRFRDLKGEAFVLDERSGKWESRGIVMDNCWPYDQPMRMKNGNFITGGQDMFPSKSKIKNIVPFACPMIYIEHSITTK